jgi:hypothetical protein
MEVQEVDLMEVLVEQTLVEVEVEVLPIQIQQEEMVVLVWLF